MLPDPSKTTLLELEPKPTDAAFAAFLLINESKIYKATPTPAILKVLLNIVPPVLLEGCG